MLVTPLSLSSRCRSDRCSRGRFSRALEPSVNLPWFNEPLVIESIEGRHRDAMTMLKPRPDANLQLRLEQEQR